MQNQIFINLAVSDLEKSADFFTKLGFRFNKKLGDETVCCLIINDSVYITLIDKEFFSSFTNKSLCDTAKSAEVIMTLAVESRARVDEMVDAAIKYGGTLPHPPQDHGWLYNRTFEDLDGHVWEIVFIDNEMMSLN